jgi:glycosyltransferase involved in cell wall biosynthesis
LKLGILSREYPPLTHVGGIATYSAAAARLMADRGHQVHVVCNGPEASIAEEGGVTVHRVPMLPHHFRPGRLWYPYRRAYRRLLPHYLDALTWARTAARYFASRPEFAAFDAWEYPETMGEGALLPAEGLRARRVCRIHTGWMDSLADNAMERRLLLGLQKRACRAAGRVVSPSAYMAGSYAREILGISGKVEVSRNPIRLWDEPIAWETKHPNHVLFVGRVEWRKGLQVLLAALEAMGPDSDGLIVRVVGSMHPPTRREDRECIGLFETALARSRARSGGYALEYAGRAAHADMRRHYDWAGLLVLPSLMENYPYAALEGLSRGCWLLGSEVGGIPEIIDRPARGELFPAENSAILGRKMGEYRRRARELPALRRQSAEEMRVEFGPEACYGRLLEIYGAEIGERASR